MAALPYTLIFLETPQRLRAALADLAAELGGERRVAVARELTKRYEEIWRGTLAEAVAYFSGVEPRGEFTLVVAGASPEIRQWSEAALEAAIEEGLAQGMAPSALARSLAEQSGWPRREIYRRILARQK